MAPYPANRLLILASSATKRDGDATCRPSSDMTAPSGRPCGQSTRMERRWRSPSCPRLGFRAAATPIETYDARMTPAIAAEMKAGDLGTRWPKQKTRRRVMAPASIPACTSRR